METTNRNKRVAEYLIIDSGGFIKNAPLHEYGQELITLHDVIAEIKDKATKQRLQALPYELQYKEPDSASLKKGTKNEFLGFKENLLLTISLTDRIIFIWFA